MSAFLTSYIFIQQIVYERSLFHKHVFHSMTCNGIGNCHGGAIERGRVSCHDPVEHSVILEIFLLSPFNFTSICAIGGYEVLSRWPMRSAGVTQRDNCMFCI